MSDSTPPPLNRQRLSEARRRGHSPRSPELTAGIVLLVAAVVVPVCVPDLITALQGLATSGFQGTRGPFSIHNLTLVGPLREIVIAVARLLGACTFAALVADLAQVGFVWSPLTSVPSPERLLEGASRFVDWSTARRALGLGVKLVLGLGGIVALTLWLMPGTIGWEDPGAWLARAVVLVSRGLAVAGGICLLGGVGDAWLRQKRWIQSMQMSDDERRRQS